MYSTDFQAAEIKARQDFFHQQGRIDRQARATRAEARRVRRQGQVVNHPGLATVVRVLGAFHALRPARIR